LAAQFTTISHKDISKGIDARSAETNVQDGYSEDLVNVETNGQGHLLKRKGYQGYAGYLPIRVKNLRYTADLVDNIYLTVDGSINLASVASSPVVVQGKLPGSHLGDFSNIDSAHWYTSFKTNQPYDFPAGISQSIVLSQTDHGFTTANLWIGVTKALSTSDVSNDWFQPDSIEIDQATLDVTINYSSVTSFKAYVFISDKSAAAGQVYEQTDIAATTISIPTSTHNLDNFNIVAKTFLDTGSIFEEIEPQSVSIATNGDVTVTVTNPMSYDVKTVLIAAPVQNFSVATVPANTSATLQISNLTDYFMYWSVYEENLSTGELTRVLPDALTVDASLNILSINVTNGTSSTVNFKIYYESADISFNTLILSGAVIATGYSESTPQLSIWGISHDGIYTSTGRGGFVNHIDTYRSEAISHLVSGLGGNLFSAQPYSNISVDYLLPVLYPNMRDRVLANTVLGPTFYVTGSTPGRTRGWITGDEVGGSNLVPVVSAQYQAGFVSYILQTTNLAAFDSLGVPTTLGAVISSSDWLTVNNMGWSKLNGTFQVSSVVDNLDGTITVNVINLNVSDNDYDEFNGAGFAGIYTDQLTMVAASTFVAGDMLSSELFNKDVKSVAGSTVVIEEVDSVVSVPAGLRIFATRTAATFPLKTLTGSPSVENLVKGDMLNIDGYPQQVRVVSIDPLAKTVTLDETLTLQDASDDSVALYVAARWIPVEAPATSYDRPDPTYIKHFDVLPYNNQATVRSVSASNNLYLTDYNNEVMKYDGDNIYKAGLYRWQPGLFAQIDDTVGSIVPDASPLAFTARDASERSYTVPTTVSYATGDRVYDVTNDFIYTVKAIDTAKIYMVESLVGATNTGTIQHVATYKYYFRMNMIDANDNIVTSAVTSYQDFVVELYKTAQIKLRLVGLPTFEMYDYDRIEIEIYRTQKNLQAPFYKIQTVPVSFNKGDCYIDFVDGKSDDVLTTAMLDPVNTALLGSELGTAWSQPLRAKHVTSDGNRLILANLKDYPELDIRIREILGSTITAANLVASGQKRWLFRKNNLDTGTTTNVTTRQAYEFVSTSVSKTIVPATDIAKTSSTFTITSAAHGLLAGNWVYLYHATSGLKNSLTYAGWWQIRSVNAGDFTIAANMNVAPSSNDVDRYVSATDPRDIPVLLGTDGNYNMINGNKQSASDPYEFVAMRRLANAINSVQVVADTTVQTFDPWMTANAGNEYAAGQLIIKQPKVETTTLELVLDSGIGTNYEVYVNNLFRTASSQISAIVKLFPSRLLVSYPNYAELFDNPGATSELESDSAIDVNIDDGQEITGVIPFYGESSFRASQNEGYIVVFKTNSVYVVNLANKGVVGAQVVQKLETRGLGCTAPKSIASTDKGIIFANNSGIFRLNRDMSISYVGKFMERFWREEVNRDVMDEMTGHHYSLGHQYKLSIPFVGSDLNSEVFVYDHTREGQGTELGAWTRFTNHPVTGWANLNAEAFFASTKGEVFTIRRTETVSDFRDDSAAIPMTILYKALDFGDSGRRKVCHGIVNHMKIVAETQGTQLLTAIDLRKTFESDGLVKTPMISDRKVISLKSSLPTRRFLWLQVKYMNAVKDEPCELAGIDFVVGGLTRFGITQADTV
jgi:hypothetical protein